MFKDVKRFTYYNGSTMHKHHVVEMEIEKLVKSARPTAAYGNLLTKVCERQGIIPKPNPMSSYQWCRVVSYVVHNPPLCITYL